MTHSVQHVADDTESVWDSDSARAMARIDRIVEWIDTDASGHYHNSTVIRWVEAAEARLVRALNLPDYFPTAPRVRQEVNYRAKLWFGQRVTIWITAAKMGRSSLTYAFKVVANSTEDEPGVIAAEGTVTAVHVPVGASASAPWPEELRALLGFGTGGERTGGAPSDGGRD